MVFRLFLFTGWDFSCRSYGRRSFGQNDWKPRLGTGGDFVAAAKKSISGRRKARKLPMINSARHSKLNKFLWRSALFLLALRPIEAFDTFWQLQSGKYIWQTGAFIYTDIFSITKDVLRVEHCWLSDLCLLPSEPSWLVRP